MRVASDHPFLLCQRMQSGDCTQNLVHTSSICQIPFVSDVEAQPAEMHKKQDACDLKETKRSLG
jgi:hypothetical protein